MDPENQSAPDANNGAPKRHLSQVNQLRKMFDQDPGNNSSIAGNARPRRPTMDGLNPVRRRGSLGLDPSVVAGIDEQPEEPENVQQKPVVVSARSQATYGVRNYERQDRANRPSPFQPRTQAQAPPPDSDEIAERRQQLKQEMDEFEEQKKNFNTQFSRFLTKKEEFLDKVEQFDSEKEAFDAEKRKFDYTKQMFEQERSQFQSDLKMLESEKAALAQKQEILTKEQQNLTKEQQDLLSKKNTFELEKKTTMLNISATASKSQEVDELTTRVTDLANQIETQNQTHLVLQQVIDSLTLQLQQETSNSEKLKNEMETLRTNFSRNQQQSVMMLEEWSTTQKEWKKTEKKLKTQVKSYQDSMEHFVQEREQLNKDREAFEKTKLSLVESENSTGPSLKEERWDDKAWVQAETKKLAQDRQKVAVIKRYTETERLRVGELKKRIEAEQLQIDQMHQELAQFRAQSSTDSKKNRSRKETKTPNKDKTKAKLNLSEVNPETTDEVLGTKGLKSPTNKDKSMRINLTDELKTNTFDATELSPRSKTDSGPDRQKSTRKSTKGRKNTVDQASSGLIKKEEQSTTASSDPEPPPGDVFGVSSFHPINAKLDTFVKLLAKGEEEDFRTLQVETDGLVTRASLRCCLRRIAALPDDYDFHFTFFTIHDYFIDSVTLFKTLILFYRSGIIPLITRSSNNLITPQNTQESRILETQMLHKYQDRIIEAVIMWMGFRFENLTTNDEFRGLLLQFLTFLSQPPLHNNHGSELKKAWTYLEDMCQQFNDGKAQLFKLSTGPPNQLSLTQISSKALADQLTLEEQASFQNIELTDYYQKSWETNSTNNISRMMTRFDTMVEWFISLILSVPNETEPRERAKVLSKLIEVMGELKNLRNFNSLMQIYTALNKEPIQKLRKAWGLVSKNDLALFNKVGHFMSPNNKFGVYRAFLDEIEENSPCIPYHALLLRDLVVIEGLTSLYDEHGRIHFDTMAMLADVFYRLQDFRSVLYSLEEDPKIQIWLSNKTVLGTADVETLSNESIVGAVPTSPTRAQTRSTSKTKPASKSPRKDNDTPKVTKKKSSPALNAKASDPDHLWMNLGPGTNNALNFSKFLTDEQHKFTFECWEKLVGFKSTDFGTSAMGFITWQETGEEIVATYFASDSSKYLKNDFEKLDEIVNGFCSSEKITPSLVDPLIQYCASQLNSKWKEFVSSGQYK